LALGEGKLSRKELQLAFVSVLLYELGRLLVAWWAKPRSSTDVNSKLTLRYDPTPAGLHAVDYHYWWYILEGSRRLQTRFFGGVIEVWRQLEEPSVGRWDDVKALEFSGSWSTRYVTGY